MAKYLSSVFLNVYLICSLRIPLLPTFDPSLESLKAKTRQSMIISTIGVVAFGNLQLEVQYKF